MSRFLAAPAAVALLAAAVGFASVQALAAEPIPIGAVVALSPPGSVIQGLEVKAGLEIARDMINQRGGVLGSQLSLLFEDTQGLPERGRAAVEKLITREHVAAIVGEHQSSVALAEIEVAHRYGVLFVNTNAWADAVRERGYPEVFNPSNYNSRTARAIVEVIQAMGLKRVVALAENTDYGIGQAQAMERFMKQLAPGVEYRYQVLDRTARDYTPVVLPLRSNPPDMIVTIMLPPGGYLLINQLYEMGVSPSARTWMFDGAGITDYPDFWDNVHEAGQYVIAFGLYHPRMQLTPLGEAVRAEYRRRFQREPSRLVFQGADSLFLVAEGMKDAGSTRTQDIIPALERVRFEGTRGTIVFANAPGPLYHQWVDVPYVVYQFTEVAQALNDTRLLMGPGLPLSVANLARPKR